MGAALLFWGWQTGFLLVGALLGLVLESARWTNARWEFSEDDFSRVWTFCTLLFLAAAVYAFTANEGPSGFLGFFQNPTPATTRSAGNASARTAASLILWLPMIFFLFVATQVFSSQEGVPLETISLILRRRWKRAQRSGQPPSPKRNVNICYPYFILCLFASSIHVGEENNTFYWGLCALVAWGLWPQRSPRFGLAPWLCVVAVALALGWAGQRGLSRLQAVLANYNPSWFSHAVGGGADPTMSKTALGHIGRLMTSGKIVIRLKPKAGQSPPTLLREASYRNYRREVWSSGTSERDFISVPETNGMSYLLLPGKTNTASVNIACYLPGGKALLPLPSGSGRLENLPLYVPAQINAFGAVLAQGPGLVIFDALYGPGATIDSLPSTNEDLAITPRETNALDEVISELQLAGLDQERRLRAISRFFLEKFNYSTWQTAGQKWGADETPVSRFLLQSRSGHCEYFATATVLLLRRLQIPARYAVGYAVHEGSASNYVVRQRDAHAWCLVWNDRSRTWQDFDTTPPSWVEAEAKRASVLQFLSDAWSRFAFELAKLRWGQTHLRQYLLWALAPILAVLLYRIFFGSRRQRRHLRQPERGGAVWPGIDSEFYELEKKLVERGHPRQPGEPLSSWLVRAAADPVLAPVRASLQELLRLHYRYRFDPQGLSQSDREGLRREAAVCLESLTQSRTPRYALAPKGGVPGRL